MKKRAFIFTELIVAMGVFSAILFPMIMLMNKNIKIVQNLRTEYEITKTAGNIENILINLSGKNQLSERYFLEFDKKQKTAVLKTNDAEVIVLRNINYLSYGEIEISEKKIFFQNNNETEKEFGEVQVFKIKLGDIHTGKFKEIRKVLTGNLYDYTQ